MKNRIQKGFRIFLTFIICLCLGCISFLSVSAQEPEIVSEFAYVIDLHNQEVVYEKNGQERMFPASMTKLMTVLVALEQIDDLDEVVTLEPEVFEGLKEAQASVVGYYVNEEASLRELLYGIMLPSGADASRAVAIHVAGSEANFVDLMNEKAKELGLQNTHFVNTSGLHDENHYSTAQDIANLLQVAIKNEAFYKIFTTEVYQTTPSPFHPQGIMLYTTRLQKQNISGLPNFIKGSKTGFTLEGGLCLASLIEEEGMNFISVTGNAGNDMNGIQHLVDAYSIYQFMSSTYGRSLLLQDGESFGTMKVQRGKLDEIAIAPTFDVYIYKTWIDQPYTIEWVSRENIAPIQVGDVVGEVKLIYEGGESESFDVKAMEAVELNTFFFILSNIVSPEGLITTIAFLVIVLFTMYSYRTIRRRNALK